MAKKKRNGDAGKLRPISMNKLTPETRLAIGVGQLVLDYVVSKIMPPDATARSAGQPEVGLGELKKRLQRAITAELRPAKKARPKRGR